jgi:phage-related protein
LLLQVNLITAGNDLGGAKVVRIRTLKKYLDGQAGADPHAKFPDEIWYVDRKSNENRAVVEFELASKFDLVGVMLPRRQIIANVCQWKYRSAECGYTGPPVADANDNYLQGSSNAVLNDYLQKIEAYRSALNARVVASSSLSSAQNNLNRSNETYVYLSTQYTQSYPRSYVETGARNYAYWNANPVSLGSEYRQGAFRSKYVLFRKSPSSVYEIERWGIDYADVAAKQAQYNAALSAYNAAVSAEATALANATAARNAYLALGITDPADQCGKRISSCNLRFKDLITGEAELPFGSFPGAGLSA